MIMDDYDGQMIFGDLGGLKLPDISLTGEKTSPRKLVPTGDRTRARCVTGAHAKTCPTAVDTRPYRLVPVKVLGYSRESNAGPLGWMSDVLTTVPKRRSFEMRRNINRVKTFYFEIL